MRIGEEQAIYCEESMYTPYYHIHGVNKSKCLGTSHMTCLIEEENNMILNMNHVLCR